MLSVFSVLSVWCILYKDVCSDCAGVCLAVDVDARSERNTVSGQLELWTDGGAEHD